MLQQMFIYPLLSSEVQLFQYCVSLTNILR